MKFILLIFLSIQVNFCFAEKVPIRSVDKRKNALESYIARWDKIVALGDSKTAYKNLLKSMQRGDVLRAKGKYFESAGNYRKAQKHYPSARMLVENADSSSSGYLESATTNEICPNNTEISYTKEGYHSTIHRIRRSYLLAIDFDNYEKGNNYNKAQNLSPAEKQAVRDKLICLYDVLVDQDTCQTYADLAHCF